MAKGTKNTLAERRKAFDDLTGHQWQQSADGKSKTKTSGDGAKHTWRRPGSQKK